MLNSNLSVQDYKIDAVQLDSLGCKTLARGIARTIELLYLDDLCSTL